jgi:3-methylcrotonyl-CoA carboxylase alpha subunit
MNTRLQVEHPVTEAITGLDLVEWQLRVANGEPLPKRPEELAIRGHAIEARIYAEDPRHEFRPSIGLLAHLVAPSEAKASGEAHVRVDSGVRAGDSISVHYDPLIAKLIVSGATREEAIARLRRALEEYEIAGVTTNIAFLRAVAAHPDYRAGHYDTGFLGRQAVELAPPPRPASREVLAAAVQAVLTEQRRKSEARAAASSDPWSPWNECNSWRMNGAAYQDIVFADGEVRRSVRVFPRREGAFGFECGEERGDVSIAGDRAFLDGVKLRARAVWIGFGQLTVFEEGSGHTLRVIDPLATSGSQEEAGGRLTAPMPGRIMQVLVKKGADVERGAPLMILEAMKMQYTISAPADGRVAEVRYAAGDVVEEGAELISFAEQSFASNINHHDA